MVAGGGPAAGAEAAAESPAHDLQHTHLIATGGLRGSLSDQIGLDGLGMIIRDSANLLAVKSEGGIRA